MLPLTDLQRLFAAKYVELECSVAQAAAACGIKVGHAEQIRTSAPVTVEIDRLLSLAAKDAVVSRAYCRNRLITIIERCMEGEPVLHEGKIIAGVVRFKPQGAIAAIKVLHEQGYVEETHVGEEPEQLTDEERAGRILQLIVTQRAEGDRPAPKRSKKTS